MADRRADELDAQTGAGLASADRILHWDESANATKTISYTELLNALRASLLKDEDDMASDSATHMPSQQSTKAYVDDGIGALSFPSGLEFVSSQDAAASATLDFTGFDASSYDSYIFILQNVIPTASAYLTLRTSTDGGSTYDSGSGNYEWAQHGMINSGSHALDGITSQTSIHLTASDNGSKEVDTAGGVSGRVEVLGPHLSQWTMINAGLSYICQNGNRSSIINAAGHRESAADVDAVQFLFDTGNIASGTITMYGLRNSGS